jgi:hypothetical protein
VTEDVAELTHLFMAAVRDRDVSWLDGHLGAEFTLTTGRAAAPVRGRAEWLEITRERYEIEEFVFDEVESYDYGPTALVRSRYRQRGSMGGERRDQAYLMTDVWVEREGRPQLVSRHISPLPD